MRDPGRDSDNPAADADWIIAPARGTYEDPSGPVRGFWEVVIAACLGCAIIAFFGVVALYYAAHGGMPNSSGGPPASPLNSALAGLGLIAASILAPLIFLPRYMRAPARRVAWDEEGLQVTKYYGGTFPVRWEDVLGLRQRYASTGHGGSYPAGVYVSVSGDRSFTIDCTSTATVVADETGAGSGYNELIAALQTHLGPHHGQKTVGAPAAAPAVPPGPPRQIECNWCGATFPEGTKTCPQCGRPVPATAAGTPAAAVIIDRPVVAPVGRVTFPRQHEEIFRPGRLYMQRDLWVLLPVTVLVAAAFFYHYVAIPRTQQALAGAVWSASAAVAAAGGLVAMTLGYLWAAVALTGGGLYYRDPLHRVQFITWEGLEKVEVVRAGRYTPLFMADCADAIYVTGRTVHGRRVTLKLATAHRWVWPSQNPAVAPDAIASALIRRGGLVVSLKTHNACTWVHPDAGGGPTQA